MATKSSITYTVKTKETTIQYQKLHRSSGYCRRAPYCRRAQYSQRAQQSQRALHSPYITFTTHHDGTTSNNLSWFDVWSQHYTHYTQNESNTFYVSHGNIFTTTFLSKYSICCRSMYTACGRAAYYVANWPSLNLYSSGLVQVDPLNLSTNQGKKRMYNKQ